jgi:hypothetical protein
LSSCSFLAQIVVVVDVSVAWHSVSVSLLPVASAVSRNGVFTIACGVPMLASVVSMPFAIRAMRSTLDPPIWR